MFLNLLTCLHLYTFAQCSTLFKRLKVGATVEIEAKENHVDHANLFFVRFLCCSAEWSNSHHSWTSSEEGKNFAV